MTKHEIHQGDNSPIRRVRFESVPSAQAVCFQSIRKTLQATPLISRYVTGTVAVEGNDWFQVFLTPEETSTLPVGIYQWIVELQASGSSPPLRKELHDTLDVKAQGIEV